MAEFNFYSTSGEWDPFFELLVQRHLVRFAVDREYESPECPYHTSLADAKKLEVQPISRVYLLNDAYARSALHLRRQQTGPQEGKYFIDMSRGGPAMELTFPSDNRDEALTRILPERLSFRKVYWNDDLTRAYPAPKELKDVFGGIKRSIQRWCTKKVLQGECWVSALTWDLFERGEAIILDEGKWFHRTPEGVRSKNSAEAKDA